MKSRVLNVAGVEIRRGTSIYDTEYDRLFWIDEIDDYEVMIQTVTPYEDDDPIWWSSDDDPTKVADGASIGIDKFESLVTDGRFEVSSQPRGR